MFRVDVEGIAIRVQNEGDRLHLERVNRKLARMKLALHRIAGGAPEAVSAALEGLKDV